MELVSRQEIAELTIITDEELVERLAREREYRGRVEHELMSRMDERGVVEIDTPHITATKPRPRVQYVLTKSKMEELKERNATDEDLAGSRQIDQPYISLKFKQEEEVAL